MTVAEARIILGLAPSFSTRDLKRAYRRAAAAHHPDRGGSTERMVRVNNAFEALSGRPLVATGPAAEDFDREIRHDRSRRRHPLEPQVRTVSLVLAILVWVAGIIDTITEPPTLRSWIVIGLPFCYLAISIPARLVLWCGSQMYSLWLKVREAGGQAVWTAGR